jgi:hypothetical protein
LVDDEKILKSITDEVRVSSTGKNDFFVRIDR